MKRTLLLHLLCFVLICVGVVVVGVGEPHHRRRTSSESSEETTQRTKAPTRRRTTTTTPRPTRRPVTRTTQTAPPPTARGRTSDDKILSINSCKLCGKFSVSGSKRESGKRQKREIVVDVPGNESLVLDNGVVRITGKLTPMTSTGDASPQIPRYKFHFSARIRNRFQLGNSTMAIPIDLKAKESYRSAKNITAIKAEEPKDKDISKLALPK